MKRAFLVSQRQKLSKAGGSPWEGRSSESFAFRDSLKGELGDPWWGIS